jgi:hypothetical protein
VGAGDDFAPTYLTPVPDGGNVHGSWYVYQNTFTCDARVALAISSGGTTTDSALSVTIPKGATGLMPMTGGPVTVPVNGLIMYHVYTPPPCSGTIAGHWTLVVE